MVHLPQSLHTRFGERDTPEVERPCPPHSVTRFERLELGRRGSGREGFESTSTATREEVEGDGEGDEGEGS